MGRLESPPLGGREFHEKGTSLDEWTDDFPHPLGPVGWTWLVVVGGIPGLIFGVAAWLLIGAPAAGVVVIAYVLVAWGWVRSQGRLALRSIGARRLSQNEAPRLANLVAGLSQDLGVSTPSVWIADLSQPNALVCTARGPALAFARRISELLTRTELEAVVAHCLLRTGRSALIRAAAAAALGPLAGPVAPHVGEYEDARAAAVTHYPPALAAAMAKCEPVSGRFAPLFFVGKGTSHVPAESRREALSDL